jgi:N-methylhydantoinase A/oxoprolinase/acetone carboxylase beta subunit
MDIKPVTWRIWKLIPVKAEGALAPSKSLTETLGSGTLPPYDGDAAGQSSTRAQYAESEHDEFGTVVNEVTVVTTVTTNTVTTRKRYRVEDA